MSTQIQKRQIADGAIDNSKVSAGAAIATNKLADGAEFLKRSGSIPLTGNLDANNNKVVNLPTPTASGDAVPKGYIDTAIANLPSAFKFRNARAASTANVNITNPGTDTFDGIALSNGDRILIRAQSAAAENGIYIFNGSGSAMTRADDANAWTEFPGSIVTVNEGATYAEMRFYSPVNDGGTLGTTAITYTQDPANPLNAANFVDKEIPSGAIDGANTAFTLANTPVSGSEHVFLNGILQESGGGNDYTISGANITLLTAPLAGEKLRVSYRR